MLYWLAEYLQEYLRSFAVFQYLTVRAILGVLTALGISLLLGPWFIRRLTELRIGQSIRVNSIEIPGVTLLDPANAVVVSVKMARGAVKAMKAAVSTAQTVQEIIQAGLDFVKQSEWYQNLSKKEQNDVDANFQDYINKPFQGTETKKSRLKIFWTSPVPSGESPLGTGPWPVLPIK